MYISANHKYKVERNKVRKNGKKREIISSTTFFHALYNNTTLDELNVNIYIQEYLCFL